MKILRRAFFGMLPLPLLSQVLTQSPETGRFWWTPNGVKRYLLPAEAPKPGQELGWVDPPSHEALCHKEFLQFWRLFYDSGEKGAWHLLIRGDKGWPEEMVRQLAAAGVEYFALPGSLPK